MSDQRADLILEHLRAIRADIAEMRSNSGWVCLKLNTPMYPAGSTG
ncbi:MAG: hypothetical protein WA184_01340 [Stellaceae bacterium]|jgi:hypothetical protein